MATDRRQGGDITADREADSRLGAKRPDLSNSKLATGMRTPSLPIMIG